MTPADMRKRLQALTWLAPEYENAVRYAYTSAPQLSQALLGFAEKMNTVFISFGITPDTLWRGRPLPSATNRLQREILCVDPDNFDKLNNTLACLLPDLTRLPGKVPTASILTEEDAVQAVTTPLLNALEPLADDIVPEDARRALHTWLDRMGTAYAHKLQQNNLATYRQAMTDVFTTINLAPDAQVNILADENANHYARALPYLQHMAKHYPALLARKDEQLHWQAFNADHPQHALREARSSWNAAILQACNSNWNTLRLALRQHTFNTLNMDPSDTFR